MEEGRAGHHSQDFIRNKGKKLAQESAGRLNIHDIESINDVSSIHTTESEDESSNSITVKHVPRANSKSQTNRLASGILRGVGTLPNTPTRSVRFRNSPDVRYI